MPTRRVSNSHDCSEMRAPTLLEDAYDAETMVLVSTVPEREEILRVLDDPPESLAELRGVLLREHQGRGARGWPGRDLDL